MMVAFRAWIQESGKTDFPYWSHYTGPSDSICPSKRRFPSKSISGDSSKEVCQMEFTLTKCPHWLSLDCQNLEIILGEGVAKQKSHLQVGRSHPLSLDCGSLQLISEGKMPNWICTHTQRVPIHCRQTVCILKLSFLNKGNYDTYCLYVKGLNVSTLYIDTLRISTGKKITSPDNYCLHFFSHLFRLSVLCTDRTKAQYKYIWGFACPLYPMLGTSSTLNGEEETSPQPSRYIQSGQSVCCSVCCSLNWMVVMESMAEMSDQSRCVTRLAQGHKLMSPSPIPSNSTMSNPGSHCQNNWSGNAELTRVPWLGMSKGSGDSWLQTNPWHFESL